MKALRKLSHGHDRVAVVDVPEPHAREGQVVVKVERAGICGTDIHILHDQFSKVRPPVTLGHEFAGSIAEVGPGIQNWRAGDRVVVESEAHHCGLCRDCLSGFTNLCSERLACGSSSDGGFASYVAVRASALHRLPEKLTFQEAALGEPLAVGVHAVMECGNIKAGDWVLVTGPGPIGLIVLQVAKSSGAKVIISGTEKDEPRLLIAAGMGADHVLRVDRDNLHDVIPDLTDDVGIDAAFECSGTSFALNDCLSSIKRQGQIIQVGLFGRAVESELDQIALKEIMLRGAFAHNHRSWIKAMDLIENKTIDLKTLISGEFPLSDWREAFRLSEEGKGIKYLLRPID